MRLLILAGGPGQPLWPFSTAACTKPFVPFLKNESGGRESMLQRLWRKLERAGLAGVTVISAEQSKRKLIEEQLDRKAEFIGEPERRDTFPAIALAAGYLHERGVGRDEVLIVLPVDFDPDDGFFAVLPVLEACVLESRADIALLGADPAYPAGHYGYILPAKAVAPDPGPGLPVIFFVEKPSLPLAECLMEQGALWNCGVFAFRLGHVLDLLAAKGLPERFGELQERYAELPKRSFDFEVLEHELNLRVVPYQGKWKDLGNWESLAELMGKPVIGPGTMSEDCTNVHLVNELDVPVMLVGVSDVVVAATRNGILVADKRSCHRIKDLLPAVQPAAGRPVAGGLATGGSAAGGGGFP